MLLLLLVAVAMKMTVMRELAADAEFSDASLPLTGPLAGDEHE